MKRILPSSINNIHIYTAAQLLTDFSIKFFFYFCHFILCFVQTVNFQASLKECPDYKERSFTVQIEEIEYQTTGAQTFNQQTHIYRCPKTSQLKMEFE